MSNAEIIAAVKRWQTAGYLHPLTCGQNSAHRPLVPHEHDSQVHLLCPDCSYRQTSIPDVVLYLRRE